MDVSGLYVKEAITDEGIFRDFNHPSTAFNKQCRRYKWVMNKLF